MSFCPKCGKELASDAKFCGGCGTALVVGSNKPTRIWLHVLIALLIFAAIGATIKYVVLPTIAYLFVPVPASEDRLAINAKMDSLRLISEAATKTGAITDDAPIDFVVSISGTEDHFLKAAIVFEYDENNKALGAELRKGASGKYKDIVIKYMSNLSFAEVSDPSERDKICQELKRSINASLPANIGGVQSVMFTMYILQ